MEPCLALRGLFWEPWWPKSAVKNNTKCMFLTLRVFAILALLERFWEPSWLVLGDFVTKNGIPNPVKSGPKCDPKFDYFLLSLGAVLGSILGPDWTENPIKSWTKILT